jgi:CitMHS family citrate-Mg2+:H+ or citrate-Ca2+:H+ symporter
LRRPRLFAVNVVITLAVVVTMITGLIEPVVVFMAGTALALIINYPSAAQQRERIDAHARAALMMAGILFAAGAFTGIMTGSGMIKALAQASAAHSRPARHDRDAAQPDVRSRQFLFRRAPGDR